MRAHCCVCVSVLRAPRLEICARSCSGLSAWLASLFHNDEHLGDAPGNRDHEEPGHGHSGGPPGHAGAWVLKGNALILKGSVIPRGRVSSPAIAFYYIPAHMSDVVVVRATYTDMEHKDESHIEHCWDGTAIEHQPCFVLDWQDRFGARKDPLGRACVPGRLTRTKDRKAAA